MAKSTSYIKSTLFYIIGVFGSKVILFALVPVYSFYLSREELGEYDLLLISITLLTPLITLQLSDGVYRHLLQSKKKKKDSRIISTGLAIIFIGYFIFLLLSWLLNLFLDYNYFLEFVLLQLSSCLFIYFQQVTRGLSKNKLYAFMGATNSFLVLGLSALFLFYFKMRVNGILLSLFISQILTITGVVALSGIHNSIRVHHYNKSLGKKLLNYSWPLLPNAISWWLIDLGNRYIILFFLNEEYNGIYAIAARYAGIIAIFNSVFILTWQDYAISDHKDDQKRSENFSKVFNQFMVFELTVIIILTSIGKYLIKFTTDIDYHMASNYLPILLLSAGFASFCAYYGAFYLKKKDTLGVFTTTIIGGLVNIGISILLIKQIGLYAVAIGSLSGFITTFWIRSYQFKLTINYKLFILCISAFIIALFVQFNNNRFMSIGLIFASILFFIILNWKLLVALLSKLKTYRMNS